MNIAEKSKWLSRKFLVVVGDAIFMILNEGMGWGVPKDVYLYLLGIVVAYLAAEGIIDAKST